MDPRVFAVSAVLVAIAGFLFASKIFDVKSKKSLHYLGGALFVLGAFLNAVERFNTGCVLDYFNFSGLFMFNINDVFVDAGVIIILVNQLIGYNTVDKENQKWNKQNN